MDKIKFIHLSKDEESGKNIKNVVVLNGDMTLSDLLEEFKHFCRTMTYSDSIVDRIQYLEVEES